MLKLGESTQVARISYGIRDCSLQPRDRYLKTRPRQKSAAQLRRGGYLPRSAGMIGSLPRVSPRFQMPSLSLGLASFSLDVSTSMLRNHQPSWKVSRLDSRDALAKPMGETISLGGDLNLAKNTQPCYLLLAMVSVAEMPS